MASTTNSQFIRRYLIEKTGEWCQRCGWNERNPVTGRVPVEVEHIDGDWRNNSLDNLILLCPNCHSLTTTFRALNRGRGRTWRRTTVALDQAHQMEERRPLRIEAVGPKQMALALVAPT